MDGQLSQKILTAAIEIKKNAPAQSFSLVLKDLIGGIRQFFQLDEASVSSRILFRVESKMDSNTSTMPLLPRPEIAAPA